MSTDEKEAAREGYARRKAEEAVTVRSEPRTYGPGGTNSWFRDIALATLQGDPGATQARARLERHRDEVDGEIRVGSDEGRRARDLLMREERAGATTTSVTGFTTPLWLTNLWASYRYPNRTFIDATMKLPLPGYGMQINVPTFTGATPANQQTENQGVNTASPAGTAQTQNVVTIADAIPISQQLYDQGGMTGLGFDQIVIAQLRGAIDAQVDTYALNQILTGITGSNNTITDNSAFSVSNFYQDVAKARESLADLAGTRLKATHIFSGTDVFSFVTRQVDATTNRPIVTPAWSAEPWSSLKAQGDSAGDGWLGHVLPGDIAWFSDDNIPTLSGNNQLIVSRPNSVLSFESDIFSFAYPENGATSLTVMVGVREYCCVVARFPNAHSVINGSAYITTNV